MTKKYKCKSSFMLPASADAAAPCIFSAGFFEELLCPGDVCYWFPHYLVGCSLACLVLNQSGHTPVLPPHFVSAGILCHLLPLSTLFVFPLSQQPSSSLNAPALPALILSLPHPTLHYLPLHLPVHCQHFPFVSRTLVPFLASFITSSHSSALIPLPAYGCH